MKLGITGTVPVGIRKRLWMEAVKESPEYARYKEFEISTGRILADALISVVDPDFLKLWQQTSERLRFYLMYTGINEKEILELIGRKTPPTTAGLSLVISNIPGLSEKGIPKFPGLESYNLATLFKETTPDKDKYLIPLYNSYLEWDAARIECFDKVLPGETEYYSTNKRNRYFTSDLEHNKLKTMSWKRLRDTLPDLFDKALDIFKIDFSDKSDMEIKQEELELIREEALERFRSALGTI